jgi:histidine triad (HIT) family protein
MTDQVPTRRDPTCLFCRIVAGEIPSTRVAEDELAIAIRDIAPRAPTHILILPREHIPSAADLTDADAPLVGRLFALAAAIARSEGIAEGGYRIVTNVGRWGGGRSTISISTSWGSGVRLAAGMTARRVRARRALVAAATIAVAHAPGLAHRSAARIARAGWRRAAATTRQVISALSAVGLQGESIDRAVPARGPLSRRRARSSGLARRSGGFIVSTRLHPSAAARQRRRTTPRTSPAASGELLHVGCAVLAAVHGSTVVFFWWSLGGARPRTETIRTLETRDGLP